MIVSGQWEKFMEEAHRDVRLGPSHYSLYMAILYLCRQRGGRDGIEVNARILMPLSKIASPGPYHRIMRELHEYGYIRYEPSWYSRRPSKVWLGNT